MTSANEFFRKYIDILKEQNEQNSPVIQMAEKINGIIENALSAAAHASNETGNFPGKLFSEVTDKNLIKSIRGDENARVVRFRIPIVMGERAERDATNTEKRWNQVYQRLVGELRGDNWLFTQPTRENRWGNVNNPDGVHGAGYTSQFYLASPDNT